MNVIFHALALNLHQPSGNLEALLDSQQWEAKQIRPVFIDDCRDHHGARG